MDENDVISLNETNGPLPAAALFGGDGNDTLTGGTGDDQLDTAHGVTIDSRFQDGEKYVLARSLSAQDASSLLHLAAFLAAAEARGVRLDQYPHGQVRAVVDDGDLDGLPGGCGGSMRL